jgi:hypothetical protein
MSEADLIARLDRLEKLLQAMVQRPQANPLEAIGKLMESELVTGLQEKASAYEEFTKTALKDIYKQGDRIESKLNLLSGQLLNR